jgi:hypothetical protein
MVGEFGGEDLGGSGVEELLVGVSRVEEGLLYIINGFVFTTDFSAFEDGFYLIIVGWLEI